MVGSKQASYVAIHGWSTNTKKSCIKLKTTTRKKKRQHKPFLLPLLHTIHTTIHILHHLLIWGNRKTKQKRKEEEGIEKRWRDFVTFQGICCYFLVGSSNWQQQQKQQQRLLFHQHQRHGHGREHCRRIFLPEFQLLCPYRRYHRHHHQQRRTTLATYYRETKSNQSSRSERVTNKRSSMDSDYGRWLFPSWRVHRGC